MTRFVVTGGTGFIGRPLVEKLRASYSDVLVLGSKQGDIADTNYFEEIVESDVVFHLAANTYVPDSWDHPSDFTKTNVLGTNNVLDYCVKSKARLIFVSAYIYGPPKSLPVSEKSVIAPNNPYALSKLLAEQLCEFYAKSQKIDVTVIRPFNVYGPGQRTDFLIPKIVQQLTDGKEIKMFDSSPKRDYVYIDDLVDAMTRAINTENGYSVINIGSGQSLSVSQIIEVIQDVAGTAIPVKYENKQRINEINDVYADISSAQELLSWKPTTSFTEGIKKLLETEGVTI